MPSRVTSDLKATAYHEAGHAVAMVEFEVHFEKVSILGDLTKLGFVKCTTEGRSTGDAGRLVHNLHEIVCDLAGPITHARAISGTPFTIVGSGVGFADDRTKASLRCQMIVNDFLLAQSSGGAVNSSGLSPEAKNIEYVLYLATVALIENRWPEIEAVANGLLQYGEVAESQVKDLCASAATRKG